MQCEDVRGGQSIEFMAKRGARAERNINFVPAPLKSAGQIGQMPFAAAERARRTEMQDSQISNQ